MGTGISTKCERCGNYLDYADGFERIVEGYEHDLCGNCLKEIKRKKWDDANTRISTP